MAAAGAPIRVPVAVACRVLGRSTQGYYKWLRDPVPQRDWDDAHLIDVLREIHADDPTLGYRFLADELADQGATASDLSCTGLVPRCVDGGEAVEEVPGVGADARGRGDGLFADLDGHGAQRP